jgi:hypothetical protein
MELQTLRICWSLLCLLSGVAALSSTNSGSGSRQLLVVGLGRVGTDCALMALDHFDRVYGTVRNMDGISMKQDGIARVLFDPEALEPIYQKCTHVLITVPQPKQPDPNLNRLLSSMQSNLPSDTWIGLISTTGVYGNHDGAWVDEDSPLLSKEGSNAALYISYENEWTQSAGSRGQRLRIFRSAGIYDFSRSALHTVYKNGFAKPVQDTNDVTNRIHSLDIARAVLASMNKEDKNIPFRMYNLADDLPESRAVVLEHGAELLQSIGVTVKEPAKPTDTTSTRGRRRLLDRKLVSNQRMREELISDGLLFPTYKEGLEAILKDPTTPWH